jgi:hypothetical protein
VEGAGRSRRPSRPCSLVPGHDAGSLSRRRGLERLSRVRGVDSPTRPRLVAVVDVAVLREQRRRLLIAVYEQTDGYVDYVDVGLGEIEALPGIDAELLDRVVEDVAREGFIVSNGEMVSLTAAGQAEAERIIEPEDSAALGVISIAELRRLEEFLGQVQHALDSDELELSDDAERELLADMESITAQTAGSPRPKRSLIGIAVRGIGRIVEAAGGNAIGAAAFELARALLH